MPFAKEHNMTMLSRLLVLAILVVALAACSSSSSGPLPSSIDQITPDWVESVYPTPGADVAVPDAVEVDYRIRGTNQDVRLTIDGVDVTVYANVGPGELRYESGPVDLGARDHTASVELVQLKADGTEEVVVDSFEWQFRTR